ncbi:sigma-54-dependent Fis family transcriptional regulator [Paraburkholderia sabiae]|uniref:Sigma-54-dependent Fis family transcriptional regulator n=1 Tax=Paraburkholderia sabiae TaxID=273251 RepID=A0ABU9Q7C9_9BURK|nr:sigma-54-dependent Fis family transcriptional regulator [Paraburkholderia sabiae]WJZ79014.1 sigma-54-dependent Fis family transcriptional regulator [Paraburkholderia sabiae]CAD6513899.1 Acetoin catabolism regulatory protein [Paraburkholderia sabiae]
MSSCQPLAGQASRVEAIMRTRPGGFAPSAPVVRSWTRCIEDYGLDPDVCLPPPVMTSAELALRREQNAGLVDCAKLEMATLYQQLGDGELAVVLTDSDGVILHLASSPEFAGEVEDWGLCAGAVWNEREAGTNGMGTCLAEGEAIAVRQHEHFYHRYTSLTCAAVPVFDEGGSIAGVLDVTSRSPLLQQHSLVLVGMSRQMIENRLLDARHTHAFRIQFHSRPEFVGTLHAGKLTVDDDGTILGANRSALAQLGFVTLDEIAGKPVTEIFNASLEEIVARSTRSSFYPVAIYRTHASSRFFVVAQEPRDRADASNHDASSLARRPARATRSTNPLRSSTTRVEFGDAQIASQFDLGARVIDRGIAVLVHGETGSGKEVFANALHAASERSNGPFVAVNCASLPEHLIESELFGYRAGAFTGAQREGRRGKILQADGGTLFLDEIGDMPLALQARLLRVLEEREVTPLGSEAVVKVDFQLVSASHRDLNELVESGQFREDLYYRLNGVMLELPPLRARKDKLALIRHLLEKERTPAPRLSADVRQILLDSDWPGNIRQLRNVLRTATALCDGDELTTAHLPAWLVQREKNLNRPQTAGASTALADTDESADAEETSNAPLNAILQAEREALLALLDKHRWNVSQVALALGITRNTLYRKMRRVHIKT